MSVLELSRNCPKICLKYSSDILEISCPENLLSGNEGWKCPEFQDMEFLKTCVLKVVLVSGQVVLKLSLTLSPKILKSAWNCPEIQAIFRTCVSKAEWTTHILYYKIYFLVSRQSRLRPKDSLLSVRLSVCSSVRLSVTGYLGIPTLVFSDTLQLGRA